MASGGKGTDAGARRHAVGLAGVLVVGLCLDPASAQQTGTVSHPGDTTVSAPAPTDLDAKKNQLRDIETNLSASETQRHKVEADIEAIRTDRVRLNAALIDTTSKVHEAEDKVGAIEKRLDTLTGSEDAIKHALESRRGTIANVLGALERMGRKPLPAILISPDDMLLAIRTSMLLGAVVPELRDQTEALASDLAELARVKASIVADGDKLSHETEALNAEQARLSVLIDARQAAQNQAESALGAEQQHAADLARQATGLRDLIGRIEADHAADAARAAHNPPDKTADAEGGSARAAAGVFRDPARLAPATAFADAKGLLPFPVSGTIVKNFGTDDGFGSAEHGISLATRPRAVVSSPSDGWVSFSGPYRTYGQLLIINTGNGYYIVLAGLDRTNVTPGQFVLAGEPVGTMGDGSVKTAAAIALGAAQPILYVEFRKDGAAIDPSPWWAKAELEKVRG